MDLALIKNGMSLIYTSEGSIGYTGDVMLHCTVLQMTTYLIERAKNENWLL